MKLIIAIVQDEDSSRLIGQLMNDVFGFCDDVIHGK